MDASVSVITIVCSVLEGCQVSICHHAVVLVAGSAAEVGVKPGASPEPAAAVVLDAVVSLAIAMGRWLM